MKTLRQHHQNINFFKPVHNKKKIEKSYKNTSRKLRLTF